MKILRAGVAALLVAGCLVSGGRAAAQVPMRLAMSAERGTPEDSTRDAGRMERIRGHLASGAVQAARRELARELRDARSAGAYPREALWLLVSLEHPTRPDRTVELLDELAESAEKHGDPVTQAQELLEAAVLYQEMRDPQQARRRVERLLPLLHSPFLPAEKRAALRARMTER